MGEGRRSAAGVRRIAPTLLPLLLYASVTVILLGRGVILHPATTVVGDAGADKTIPMWSFVWWPHALVHGLDPFDATAVWAPHGIDLSWVTSTPGPSVASAPLTALAGPVVTYNVLALGAPALSAWTAFLLARHVCGASWPSIAAGWIYGFSAYETGELAGHLNLALVPLLPICVLLVVRRVDGSTSARRFVALLGLALTGQFLISTEVFLTLVLVGVLFALLAAWKLRGDQRRRLHSVVWEAGLSVLVALVAVSPYLVHAFVVAGEAGAPLRSPFSESADALNYVVPTHRIWLRGSWMDIVTNRFTATGAERGAYVSLPLIAVVLAYALGRPRRPERAILSLGLAALVLASLGPEVRIDGHDVLPGPWKVFAKLPITHTALPVRLTVYVALVVGVIVALWLTETTPHRRRRWAVVIAGMALVAPNPAASMWAAAVPSPAFFSRGTYRTYIRRGETVLVLPFGGAGWSLLWQARTGMAFRLVGGHLGRQVIPAEERWRVIYLALGPGPVAEGIEPLFHRFLAQHGAAAIVVEPGARLPQRRLVAQLGIRPIRVAGALVYRIPPDGLGDREGPGHS